MIRTILYYNLGAGSIASDMPISQCIIKQNYNETIDNNCNNDNVFVRKGWYNSIDIPKTPIMINAGTNTSTIDMKTLAQITSLINTLVMISFHKQVLGTWVAHNIIFQDNQTFINSMQGIITEFQPEFIQDTELATMGYYTARFIQK